MEILTLVGSIVLLGVGGLVGWYFGQRYGRKKAIDALLLAKDSEAWAYARYLLLESKLTGKKTDA